MRLSEETLNTLNDYVSLCANDAELELEMLLTNRPDKEGFKALYDYMAQSEEFVLVEEINRDSLDITFVSESNARATIRGINQIREYCESGTLIDPLVIRKSRIQDMPKVTIHDYDIAFRVSRETPLIEEKADVLKNHPKKKKLFRKKRRYSFRHTALPYLRIDMTQVKQSRYENRSILESAVMKAFESYEIEIEFENESPIPKKDLKAISTNMFALMQIVIKVVTNTNKVLSKTKVLEIVNNYLNVVNPKKIPDLRQRLDADPRSVFLSYQPITLEQSNLSKEEILGITSVRTDYTVTEKADGERMLAFVDSDETLYLINNRMQVRDVSATVAGMANTLLDAEFVHKDKFGEIINLLAVFDVYFEKGSDVRSKPLVPDRLEIMKRATEKIKSSLIRVKTKTFLFDMPIEVMFKKAYVDTQYEYHTDGIILTPKTLAVGAFYKNRPHLKNTFGGTWKKTFKWKPPEENSVDMLVSFHERTFVEDRGYCMIASLKVGTNVSKDNQIDPFTVLNNTYTPKNGVTSRRFGVANMPLQAKDGFPTALNGDVIYNNTVVEFRYQKDEWLPMRVRTDKTALYQRTHSIAGAANMFTTAMNVWRSIEAPVTKEMLLNPELVPSDLPLGDSEVYYARAVSRNASLMLPMNVFHNQRIKTRIFREMRRVGGPHLIEIACGKGGDLQKWVDSKYSTVIGIDSSVDNLLNGDDGAYKRMYQLKRDSNAKGGVPQMIFLQKDMRESWNSTKEITNTGLRNLYDICRGNINKSEIDHSPAKKFYNMLNESADVVSCQFAIHYFFGSEEHLSTFCENIARLMKPGALFAGTCMDGNLVEEHLNASAGLLRGTIDENVVWEIKRLYDPNDSNKLGRKIAVYLDTINQTLDEYLVDMNLLQSKLASYDIHPLTEEETKEVNLPSASFRDWHDLKEPLEPALKEFSFMNRWFVFKKR